MTGKRAGNTMGIRAYLYASFFDNKGPVMQLPVPQGRTVTGAFYKNVVLIRLKVHFKRRRPKTGLKHLRLLHDNAPAHKARIVTEFLDSEKVNYPPNTIFSPDLARCDYFCLSNSIPSIWNPQQNGGNIRRLPSCRVVKPYQWTRPFAEGGDS